MHPSKYPLPYLLRVLFFLCSTISLVVADLRVEFFEDIKGVRIKNLTSHSSYPSSPTKVDTLVGLIETSLDKDHYGTRMRGFLHPPQTGWYTFWISGDDNCELRLSTDYDTSNVRTIASVPEWTHLNEWGKFESQKSDSIYLYAKDAYYMEILHKENEKGDHCSVGWMLPDGTTQRPFSADHLSLTYTYNPPSYDLSDWSHKQKIFFSTTSSGIPLEEDLHNFPLLVRLNSANHDFRNTNQDGSDLRFTDDIGRNLPYEIELYDHQSSRAALWVLLHNVRADEESQFITMHWGNSAAQPATFSEDVFDTSAGHIGVWHLGRKDISQSTEDATYNLSQLSDHADGSGRDGMVGLGRQFEGDGDHLANTPIAHRINGLERLSISMWIKSNKIGTDRGFVFGGNPDSDDHKISFRYDQKGALGPARNTLKCGLSIGGQTYQLEGPDSLQTTNWQYVAMTWESGDSLRLYIDGEIVEPTHASSIKNGTITSVEHLRIGQGAKDESAGWDGSIDEVRIDKQQRSASWVRLSYQTQKRDAHVLRFERRSTSPELSLTLLTPGTNESTGSEAFRLSAKLPKPAPYQISLPVPLAYSGTAVKGQDYSVSYSANDLTIPAQSESSFVTVTITPYDDEEEEPVESVVCKIQPGEDYTLAMTSSQTFEISDNDATTPVTITMQPQDLSVKEGDFPRFTISAAGTPPLSYQWYRNAAEISGANEPTYSSPMVSLEDDGTVFACVVGNNNNTVVSAEAHLAVSERPLPPRIVAQPVSSVTTIGDTAYFKVSVEGTRPFTFTWFADTAQIAQGRDPVLTLPDTRLSDNNSKYYCVVENATGIVRTRTVALTVKRPSSQMIVVTGNLYDNEGAAVGSYASELMDFVVRLYPRHEADSAVYVESFLTSDGNPIKVNDGEFVVRLGEGATSNDLTEVARNYPNLFVEFTVTLPGGNPETLQPRTPLTASPFALSGNPKLLKGNGIPSTAKHVAPVGSNYVDTESGTTFLRTYKGWIPLDD